MFRVTLAALHLLALAIGFGAILTRASALRSPITADALRRAFRADGAWGLAAALWVATGLWRYLGGIEKSAGYYSHNVVFMGKMTLLGLILALEVWPMITLLRWRRLLGRDARAEEVAAPGIAGRIAAISIVQAALVVLMVLAATAMARGYGAR